MGWGLGVNLPHQSYFICALPSRLRCGKILKSVWTNYVQQDSVKLWAYLKHFLRSYDCFVKEVFQNRGISLCLLIKNRKITKTALKWAKTVKTNKFSPKDQNITNFRISKFFWEGSIFANFRTVFPILSLFLKNAKMP